MIEKWFRVKSGDKPHKLIAEMAAEGQWQERGKRRSFVWQLTNGWTDPDYRRQGYFRMLFEERLTWVKAQPWDVIEGWCNPHNEPLFVEHGFEHVDSDKGEKLMRLTKQ